MDDRVVFSWTPAEEDGPAQGPDAFVFDLVVTDEFGGEDREQVAVVVFETNELPSFQMIEDQEIDEFEALSIQLNVMDTDIPENTFEFGFTTAPFIDPTVEGAPTIDENGLFEWTPTDTFGGRSYAVELILVDSSAGQYRQSFMVTINEVNVPPVLEVIPPITLGELSNMRLLPNAVDVDEPVDTLTFSIEDAPTGMRIKPETGEVRWDLTASEVPGDYSFTLKVTDGMEEVSQEVEVTVVEPEIRIMTFGDSITQGLPHEVAAGSGMVEFGVSYHTFLDAALPMPATYIGNPNDNLADSGAPLVGGDGSVINQIPTAAFTPPGVLESFAEIKGSTEVPDFAVVMLGTNDLMQLIVPNGADTFAPDTAGDFTSAGTFTDTDDTGSTQHEVDSMIDRYEDLLDDIAAEFPPSTKVIGVAIAPADPNVVPEKVFGGAGSRFDLAKADLASMVPVFNGQIQSLMDDKGDRFSYVNPGLMIEQLGDGLHPTNEGYAQIGVAIADFINGNDRPVLASIGGPLEVAELDTLEFDADASDPSEHGLTYSLSEDAPSGAMIDSETGEFTWTPTAAQGPSVYVFDVIVTDDGPGTFCDSERVTVNVTSDDPYDTWLAANFAPEDLADPTKEATVWGRQANPDGGKWANEFEFYLGTDPNVIDEPDFEVVCTPTGAKALYSKNEEAPLGFVDIEWSTDLTNWNDSGITRQVTGDASGGLEPVEAEVTSSSDRVFFQLVGQTPGA